ncbi:hypothetical protein BH20ACI3_BH20ACI3_22050 [soil metagenome]
MAQHKMSTVDASERFRCSIVAHVFLRWNMRHLIDIVVEPEAVSGLLNPVTKKYEAYIIRSEVAVVRGTFLG